jgi:hypothetical protein
MTVCWDWPMFPCPNQLAAVLAYDAEAVTEVSW